MEENIVKEISFLVRLKGFDSENIKLGQKFLDDMNYDSNEEPIIEGGNFETEFVKGEIIKKGDTICIYKFTFLDIFLESEYFYDMPDPANELAEDFYGYLCIDLEIQVTGFYKIYDYFYRIKSAKYFKDISDLELRLREVLTFIFWENYPEHDEFKLTFEYETKIKNIAIAEMSKYFQNEFSFLDFGDYQKLLKAENIFKDLNSLDNYLQNATTYTDFVHNVTNRGIKSDDANSFMKSIESGIGVVKEFRNCIMHNRTFDRAKEDNFIASSENLKTEINSFWADRELDDK